MSLGPRRRMAPGCSVAKAPCCPQSRCYRAEGARCSGLRGPPRPSAGGVHAALGSRSPFQKLPCAPPSGSTVAAPTWGGVVTKTLAGGPGGSWVMWLTASRWPHFTGEETDAHRRPIQAQAPPPACGRLKPTRPPASLDAGPVSEAPTPPRPWGTLELRIKASIAPRGD